MMKTGDTCWFLNTHVRVAQSFRDGSDGISVLLLTMAENDAPPFHLHHAEDETFYVLEGAVRFKIGERVLVAKAGDTVLGPRGVPHGFRVVSDHAHMLVLTMGGFQRLVESGARPAEHEGAPPHTVPTPEMQAALTALCAAVQIDVLGPPIE